MVFAGVGIQAQGADPDLAALPEQYQSAWNKGDAQGVAALYAERAIRIGEGGPLHGRQAIQGSIEKMFAGRYKGAKTSIKPGRTESVSTDVRVQEGTYEITGGQAGSQRGYYLNTYVREGGQWKIAAFTTIGEPASTGKQE
jgi:uncharacterized protein (TIGR02246 family)